MALAVNLVIHHFVRERVNKKAEFLTRPHRHTRYLPYPEREKNQSLAVDVYSDPVKIMTTKDSYTGAGIRSKASARSQKLEASAPHLRTFLILDGLFSGHDIQADLVSIPLDHAPDLV